MEPYLIFGIICILVAIFVMVYVTIDKAVSKPRDSEFFLLGNDGPLMDENGYPRHLGYSADLDSFFHGAGA